MRQNVEEVYSWIVDDVVGAIQDVFAQEGIDASVLTELRESWSRRLKESGAMGNSGINDEHEWTDKSARTAAAATATVVAHSKTPTFTAAAAYHYPQNSSTSPESMVQRSRMAIGVPHKRAAEGNLQARAFRPEEMATWSPTNPSLCHHYTGTPAVLPTLARQHQPHVMSATAAARPARASTGTMDSQFRRNTVYPGAINPSNAICVASGDNTFHVHPYSPLTTAATPQVRLSGKRKGPDDTTTLMSPGASSKAARRKAIGGGGGGNSNQTSGIIPQRDGADENPLSPPPPPEQQQEPDLDDDSTLSEGDDDEELVESSNRLIAQYDKVSRIKNRWRCQLRHGIFHVDGKDYLFKSANGDFTF